MMAFYLLESPSERTYQYACENSALIGLKTTTCDACGRNVSMWEFSGPPCLIAEGGPKYPDRLAFIGAGSSLFVLSERAARTFADSGITGIAEMAPIRIMKRLDGAIIPLPDVAPQYILAQVGGTIELDFGKMFLKKKKLCKICGGFEWNRQRLHPLHLNEKTWDGSDICRIDSIPGYFICTERIVKLVKGRKLKGFCFKAL
jgi:hypothetical protein